MSKRPFALALAALAGAGAAVVPALAQQTHTVTAGGGSGQNTFNPTTLTIAKGDTVSFVTGSGTHNVKFADEAAGRDIPTSRTFGASGTFSYVCEFHPGMEGSVTVTETASTGTTGTTGTTQTTTTPAATATATPTPAAGTSEPIVDPEPLGARPARASFCVRRSRECSRPGIAIRLDAPDPGVVTGVLRRIGAARAFGRVRFAVRRGPQTLRFSTVRGGRRPPAGRYRLALRFSGWPASAPAETVRFRVR